jgi:hypothetical protein
MGNEFAEGAQKYGVFAGVPVLVRMIADCVARDVRPLQAKG